MKSVYSYLSVDLDFWGAFKYKKEDVKSFINDILNLDIPIHVVTSHEHILRYINKYELKYLVNMDYHSDICNEDTQYELNDGTWVNFYKYPSICNYTWIYPAQKIFRLSQGRCDNILTSKWQNISQRYSSIQKIQGTTRPSTWFSPPGEVCFAISKDYLHYSMEWLAEEYKFFSRYKNQLKGYRND